MKDPVTLKFDSEEEFDKYKSKIISEAKKGNLSGERLDDITNQYGKLEGIVKEDKTPSEIIEENRRNIIGAMNDRYLNGGGRLGSDDPISGKRWTDYQKQFGAEYALTLLDGFYINPETNGMKEFPHDQQKVLEHVFLAVMDLFKDGHNFLYRTDPVISDSTRNAIGRRIIEIVQKTEFTEERYISRGLFVLTPGGCFGSPIYRQLGAEGTWFVSDLEDSAAPYNSEDTKRIINKLIPLIKGRFSE